MKRTILSLLFILASVFSYGQCSVYVDYSSGAFGAGFNTDGSPTSYKECAETAIKLCKKNGGRNCTLLYQSIKGGWWAFISGRIKDQRIHFQGVDGLSSREEAERSVRKKYKLKGGLEPGTIKVYTWYVYSNLKY